MGVGGNWYGNSPSGALMDPPGRGSGAYGALGGAGEDMARHSRRRAHPALRLSGESASLGAGVSGTAPKAERTALLQGRIDYLYALSDSITNHFHLRRVWLRQSQNLAVGWVGFVLAFGCQRHVYKTKAVKFAKYILLRVAYLQLGQTTIPAHLQSAQSPDFIKLLRLGKSLETLEPIDGQAGFLKPELECFAAHAPVFANQGRLRITDHVAIVCQVFTYHGFNSASRPKTSMWLLSPSSVSFPDTRETPDFEGRLANITKLAD